LLHAYDINNIEFIRNDRNGRSVQNNASFTRRILFDQTRCVSARCVSEVITVKHDRINRGLI